MSDIFISEQGASLHKNGDVLILKKDEETFFEIELKNTDTVQIFGNIQISTQLIKEFMDRGIELAFYTMNGDLLGQITPPHIKNWEIRYNQYDLSKDYVFSMEFSREIIRCKFESSIRFLEESNRNRDSLDLRSELKILREWREKLEEVHSKESLLGTEGSFAKIYFDAYGKLFRNPEVFQGRSKRPPKDIGNSILSFLYTLVTYRISAYIDGIGFDPYIGFYHTPEYGRVSLACDMVEPVRALFCDRLTLKIFRYHHFSEKDFDRINNGIFLKRESQKRFFEIYGKEFHSDYNYGYARGSFQRYLEFILQWMRTCIKERRVIPLDENI